MADRYAWPDIEFSKASVLVVDVRMKGKLQRSLNNALWPAEGEGEAPCRRFACPCETCDLLVNGSTASSS